MMTFDQVLVFHEIMRGGSFRSAAEGLHRTQPAISLAIKKLEEQMEVELFDRTGYRPVLTAQGEAFFEKSKRVLEGMSELEELAKSFRKGEEPEISISIDGISPLPDILKLIKTFGERFSHTKLNLSFDILSETERKVIVRESQLGVTHFISHPELIQKVKITQVKMIPVVSQELFDQKAIKKQSDLLNIEQIIVGDKNSSKMSFGILDNGKKWRLEDANFKREIILAGLGWGHLPEHNIEHELKEGRLKVIEFEDIHPKMLDIYLVKLKKSSFGVVGKMLWEELELLQK